MTYIVITPVRDEADLIQKTIDSMAAQINRPVLWVIVDDGSTDGTGAVLDRAAAQFSWISVIHRQNRGFRKSGGGVIEAFYEGYARIGDKPWDFLVKLDGDLSFEPDYFARCLSEFERDSKLGIGSGTVGKLVNGLPVPDSHGDPKFHVRGAAKTYRKACWESIQGLARVPGWDTIDEVKANMLGWKTRTFDGIWIIQHKETGAGDGSWKNWVKNGLANYNTGYHPVFMALKCVKRLWKKPYLVGAAGLWTGFLKGYLSKTSRENDLAMICYVRDQQFRKLTFRRSLWD